MPKRLAPLQYVAAAVTVALATILELSFHGLRMDAPYVLFFAAVVASAWIGGLGPALLAAALSTLAIVWIVIPPVGSLAVSDPRALAGLAAFFVVAVATGMLHGRLRRANRELLDERARAEAVLGGLSDSEERLRLALEAGRMGTWDWDPATNRVRWSERLEAIYGMAPGSFDGSFDSYIAAIHPEDREAARHAVRRSSEHGGEHLIRHRVRWPDGSVHWVEGRGIVVRDDDGNVVRMVGVTADVTERERARVLSERLQHDLERRVAERTQALLETVSELEAFSYSISHDLRAPLRAMRGYADAILDEAGAAGSDPTTYARRIVEAAEHMDALIGDLLSYSRVTRADLDLEPLDLDAVVDDVLAHLPDLDARADVRVTRNGDGMPRVIGHRATLFQALTNLVSNALKFVPPGTRPSVRIRVERREGRVRLWVEDNGIGIAPEHHERIFRVFERLHGRERYPGTGVGLAIVRKAAERMGGATGVESRAGAGSRFWIELPAGPDAATTPDDGPADRARPAAHLQGS